MREWRRVPSDTLCGNCSNVIPTDEPAIFITLQNVKHPKIRCQDCVGLAPPDLPPREKPQGFTKPMRSIRQTATTFTRTKVSEVMQERPRYGEDR